MNKQRYPLIDIARLFCAGLVVFIHAFEIREGHAISSLIDACFTKQAVPYFFVVSGYFFGKKLEKSENKVKIALVQAKSVFLLYLAWQVLWLPSTLSVYLSKYTDGSVFYILALLVRRLFVAGNGAYWYLLALAEAYLICGIFVKFRKEHILYVLAAVGMILGLIYDAEISQGILGVINDIFYKIFGWSCNALMKGVPFVTMGMVLGKYSFTIRSKTLLWGSYLGINVLSVVSWFLMNRPNVVMLFPIQTLLLFLITIQPTNIKITQENSKIFRDLSSTIYFVHSIFIYCVLDVLWPKDIHMVIRWTATMILSGAVYFVVKKLRWRPLCWLVAIGS